MDRLRERRHAPHRRDAPDTHSSHAIPAIRNKTLAIDQIPSNAEGVLPTSGSCGQLLV
jgi:hypothetical protein